MIRYYFKIAFITAIVIVILSGAYDSLKIIKTYYDTNEAANNIAEKLALTAGSWTDAQVISQAQYISYQYGVAFRSYTIQQNQVYVTVDSTVTNTLITSRIKQLSHFNLVEVQGSAPLLR